jgi:hypothetical protein
MKPKYYPLGRKDRIVTQTLGSELMIYDLDADNAICLNETSSLVWQLCDGMHSASDIARDLGAKYSSPVSEDLVWIALDDLKKARMLEDGEIAFALPEGYSRREAIKRAGLATMVALPLISMIVAPSALSAQSTCIAPFGTSSGSFPVGIFTETRCLEALASRCCSGQGVGSCPCSFTTYRCEGTVTCTSGPPNPV